MAIYEVRKSIGIIFIDHPPVNSLNISARLHIFSCIKDLESNPNVKAIILCGKGSTFPVGADISEFEKPSSTSFPKLPLLVETLENCPKPVVAAIHGFALGGGLEIALGCHYRVALSNAKFSFPEVNLGILPAAGGTQRLPRVAGMQTALEWIIFGKEHSAQEAANAGVLDAIFPSNGNILDYAVQYASSIAGRSLLRRRVSKLPAQGIVQLEELIAKYKAKIESKSVGAVAPHTCLQVTGNAALLPFEKGIEEERKAFNLLVASGQSKALRYAFFAERMATKLGWSRRVSPIQVKKAAVVGLGVMGSGIAIAMSTLGIPVYVFEADEKRLQLCLNSTLKTIQRMRLRKEMSEEKSKSMQAALIPTSSYSDLKDVDLVIEVVFEALDLKKEVFRKLDKFCKPSAILATNTSALDIDVLARETSRPKQVVGMHFFAPAHRMKLLENVRGSLVSQQTVATAMDIGRRLKKATVLVGNCPGFVANRMFFHYNMISDFLLEEGAYPEEVDAVLREYGFIMGRYQVGDLAGIDTFWRVRKGVFDTPDVDFQGRTWKGLRYCPLTAMLVQRGRYGLKTGGKGWFQYANGKLCVDREVTQMIDDYRKHHNIQPRKIQPEEIIERMLYSMINEGFKILEEGYAEHPTVIDTIFYYGFSWPKHTGGPMYYAYTVGLPRVLEVIEREWARSGEDRWRPSSMLVNLVKRHGNPDIMDWMDLHRESTKSSL